MKKFFLLLIFFVWVFPLFGQGVYTAWVVKYNGPPSLDDQGEILALDDSGNVYVTGTSYYFGRDIVTIKYSPAGDTVWVSRYDGPLHNHDAPTCLAIDDSGYVYVAGSSVDTSVKTSTFPPETLFVPECVTIKYSPTGQTLWVRRYKGIGEETAGGEFAGTLAVDDSGNVYVTADVYLDTYPGGAPAIIKYSPTGDTVWRKLYPTLYFERTTGMAIDQSGNVYVTGFVYSGTLLNSYDCVTIKYSPAGDTIWKRDYNAGPDYAKDIAIDNSGNIYVAGESNADYLLIKYTPAGDTVWTSRYNGPANGSEELHDLIVDDSGYIYVTGSSEQAAGSYIKDYATVKFSTASDTVWARRYNGPASYDDGAWSLTVDDGGNVYVTGLSYDSSTSYDYATLEYSPSGGLIWVKRYSGPGSGLDLASGVGVDQNGNVYVTGRVDMDPSPSSLSTDFATIKYAPTITATPIGSNILVHPIDSLTVLFDSVETAGTTTVTTDTLGPAPPSGFQLVPNNPPLYYDIQTTATYAESVTICLTYLEGLAFHEDSLRFFHYDGLNWQDVTISLDTQLNKICARVSSFSEFVLAEPEVICLAKPGDANSSNDYSLADVIAIVNYIFNKPGCTPQPLCWISSLLCRGDWDGNTSVGLPDVIRAVNYIFNKPGGPWNALPVGVCCIPYNAP